jgi:hypothetical protein
VTDWRPPEGSWAGKLVRALEPPLDPSRPRPRPRAHAISLAVAALPAAYCVARGGMTASLWLDEILYLHFEREPWTRGAEVGRPGSFWARRLGAFGYSDLQRGIHAVLDLFGISLAKAPEVYLRLPAFLFFLLSVGAVYALAIRSGSDVPWAAGIALLFGSMPLFLFYGLEARVYSFSTLLVVVFVGLMAAVASASPGRRVAAAAAGTGAVLAWAHPWNSCLIGAMALVPLAAAGRRDWRRARRLAAVLVPGVVVVLIQAFWYFSLRAPGHGGVLLFEPQPLGSVFWSTVNGPFLSLLKGEPELLLALLLAFSIVRARGALGWSVAASVFLALALSVVVMERVGIGISPRHQAALYGGVLAALAVARPSLPAKGLLAALIGVQLVLLPRTCEKIRWKGNSAEIARAIESRRDASGVPVVVQHSFALGFPDPLLSFPLAFYVGDRTRVLELPTHRDVTRLRIAREYFLDPRVRLPEFERAPVEEWVVFLRALPEGAVWLVATPATPANVLQKRTYEAALRTAGYRPAAGSEREFDGYPTATLALWIRSKAPR